MNIRLVLNLLGKALMVEGALMLPSLGVSLYYGQGDWRALVYAAALVAAVGGILQLCARPRNDNLRAREGFATVALIWVFMSFFGGMPFHIGGYMSITDSFFECASGFTTTGATILANVEVLPRGLMFWRSFTHWVGGMGVLVLSLALVPHMGGRALHLLKAESTGPAPGKLVPRIEKSAKLLYLLYVALSIVQVIALLLCGMDLYDALIHMFGTAGTGGFSNYAQSVGHFDSVAIDLVISTFMLLFGVNFSVYFLLFTGHWRAGLRNEELRVYLGVVALAVLLIAVNIAPNVASFAEALRESYFQVSSIITTTGFATQNFDLWPQFSRTILVVLMLLGACAGSTGGGIKVIRATLLFKSIGREVSRVIRPRSVTVVRSESRVVDESTLTQVQVFFFVYLLVTAVATLIVSLDGFSFETNLTASLSAISNIGPGLGMVGPTGSFAPFSTLSKWVLSTCMLMGRLEIYPVLMLFAPSIWKRN
ncbi:MAG: TrkH family potassium uptake protein [Clostridia bacterium]